MFSFIVVSPFLSLFVCFLIAGSWYLRWTFWLQHDNLFRTGSLAPPVHCFGYSGLLWWLGYWLESTDVITQCLWRRSGWPHLEAFFTPAPPHLSSFPAHHPTQSSSTTAPYWHAPTIQISGPRLETQIPSAVLDNGPGRLSPDLWGPLCVRAPSQLAGFNLIV